jgi:D-glycero-D-manno-heptose 1,7-bisphosphate phosphatase
MRPAVFLDRDGTINRAVVRDGKPYPPSDLTGLDILPGAAEAVRRLKQEGFLIIVVTNQPDVATGKTSRATVEEIHERLRHCMPIDDFKVCYEVDSPNCTCYKPKPGLLLEAAAQRGIDLAGSYMIGDRWRDVGAGQAAGCKTFFIDCGYGEQLSYTPDWVVSSLGEAAEIILSSRAHEGCSRVADVAFR